jgi:hypothetical protein
MLTRKYLVSTKNLKPIFDSIIEGTAPPKFTTQHLKGIGFASSNDRAVIPLLKELGFLQADGTPTNRYRDYRDTSRSKQVMAEALRDAYSELFHIKAKPAAADRAAIQGKFKSTHNVGDGVAEKMAMTFYGLLQLADLEAPPPPPKKEEKKTQEGSTVPPPAKILEGGLPAAFHYNIQIHLPATKDIEVFNAIFKSLREHILG